MILYHMVSSFTMPHSLCQKHYIYYTSSIDAATSLHGTWNQTAQSTVAALNSFQAALLCRRVLEFQWSFCQGLGVPLLSKSLKLFHLTLLHACFQMVLFLKKQLPPRTCLRYNLRINSLFLLLSFYLTALCHILLLRFYSLLTQTTNNKLSHTFSLTVISLCNRKSRR